MSASQTFRSELLNLVLFCQVLVSAAAASGQERASAMPPRTDPPPPATLVPPAAMRSSTTMPALPPAVRPEIPKEYLPEFGAVHDEAARIALKNAFEHIFWLPERATPEQFYSITAAALESSYPRGEVANVLAATIEDGFMEFVDRRAAIKTLIRLFPDELGEWGKGLLERDNPFCEGRIRVSLTDSELTRGPVELGVSFMDIDLPERRTQLHGQSATLSAKFTQVGRSAASAAFKRIGTFEFRPTLSGYNQTMSFVLSVPEGFSGPIELELQLEVDPRPVERDGKESAPTRLTRHYRLMPVVLGDKDKTHGYSADMLGPNGRTLNDVALPDTVRWMFYRGVKEAASIKLMLLNVDNSNESLSNLVVNERLPEILVSKDRNDLQKQEVLDVSKGEWFLVFGATWCGPCEAIAPRVVEFGIEAGGQVLRLSLDSTPGAKLKALDPDRMKHPYDAVVDSKIADALGITSVPCVVVVKDGVVVRQEELTPNVLKELRAATAKLRSAAN